ncbi:nucleocapsid protein [Triniti virus]|uniref:Nucleoprotein n=1 Tax=Triniti virus TaxID=2496585 RepID=A0A3Q8VQB3_9VIRU|nr:nucleocapsid protein [Triniti virus]AZM68670.1 nucleocapsid protein [Triniti virus]
MEDNQEFDFTFDDPGTIAQSDFNPVAAQKLFEDEHPEVDINVVRVFFLHAGKMKEKMKVCNKQIIKAKFEKLEIEIVNTHNPMFRGRDLGPEELTLHRLSGFLAVAALKMYKERSKAEKIRFKEQVIMPLAESAGVSWEKATCAEMYLGFAPGTEFFLKEFGFYPLVIGIVRVKKGLMDPEYLTKTLRQRYDKELPVDWMTSKKSEITKKVTDMEKFAMRKISTKPHIEEFLKSLGLSGSATATILRK